MAATDKTPAPLPPAGEIVVFEQRDEAGVLLSRTQLQGDVPQGEMTRIGPDGRPVMQANYQDGVLHGTSRLWDDGLLAPTDTRNALGMALSAASHAPIGEPHYGIFRL